MKTDVQIAQEAQKQHIREIAQKVGVSEDHLELYGNFKAKVDLEVLESMKGKPDGKLILVTAINPTAAGEGKDRKSVVWGKSV